MIHEDELIADLTEVLEEMASDGSIELATTNGASGLAAPLSLVLEEEPDTDLTEWLVDRDEVVELYLDEAELMKRLARIVHRLQHGDGTPKWNDALANAIYDAPEDRSARLVFGDWLEQEADPRGQLVAIHAGIEDGEDLKDQETSLLKRYRTRLLGDLPVTLEGMTFRLGFVDVAEIDGELVGSLFANDASRFLRKLVVTTNAEAGALAIAKARLPRSLIDLQVGVPEKMREEGAVGIPAVLEHVETAFLKANSVSFAGSFAAPRLRTLTVSTYHVSALPQDLSLPELTELRFDIGGMNDGKGFVHFAEAAPKLKILRLQGVRSAASRIKELIASALLPQLEILDLTNGQLTNEEAQMIADNRTHFVHLKQLDLRGGWMREDARAELAKALPNAVVFGKNDAIREEDDDDYDDEEYEYDEDEDDGERDCDGPVSVEPFEEDSSGEDV